MIMLRRLCIATALALTATAAPSVPVGAATTTHGFRHLRVRRRFGVH